MLTRSVLKEEADPIEKEFVFTVYTQIQNLQNTFEEEGIEPENKLYMQIINKVIGNLSIPFSGEPLEGLQLMGLMETRMLDFNHLIILRPTKVFYPKPHFPLRLFLITSDSVSVCPPPNTRTLFSPITFTGFYNVPETFIFYILQA